MTESTKDIPYGDSLPAHWKVVPLKYLVKLDNGYIFKPDDWSEAGIPILRIENLNGSENYNFSTLELSKRYRVAAGDLLYSWSGNPGTSFGPFRWQKPGHFYLNQHIYKVHVHGCDPGWLFWALKAATHWIERELTSGMIGMVHVTKDELGSVPIPIPSIEEQRRIAKFLDEETARIDDLVAKKRKISALFEERAQTVIDETVQGTMLRALDGRPMGIAGMKNVRLGAMAVVQSGFTMDAGRNSGADSVTLPYLRVANVLDGSLALQDIKEVTLPRSLAERCTLQTGDVLMTEGGDPDKLGRGTVWSGDLEPCLHQNAIFAVRPDSRLLPEYLALITRTRYARSYFEMTASKSTGIAHTSSTKITGFRIPMLAVSEQRRVVHLVTESLAKMEALREIADQQVGLLTGRRQALITAAVTGQFDVPTAGRVDTSGLPPVGGVLA
ncbi:restriction endonuclease subunit S [Nonomuraea sp. AD125B]|uniref:restriction endonuclease subunit S n=1 Tax=Nonomuraea sp. AD125B TaxID=3242897 RepID=UPI0035273289